jgi:hypothetical protein
MTVKETLHVKEHDIPDVLYRGFGALEHARAFIDEGVIRLGRLDNYCNLEDARRRDQDEGKAQLRTPVIAENWEGRNLIYVLCCSAADPAYVASEFGPHVVRINNPKALVADIRAHVSSDPVVRNPRVYETWVSYDRGAVVPRPPGIDEWLSLTYSQKSDFFAPNREYRIVIMSQFSPKYLLADPMAPSNIFLRLNRRLSYCDLLQGLIRWPPRR